MCKHVRMERRLVATKIPSSVAAEQKYDGGGGGLERDYPREAPAREGQNCIRGGVAPPPLVPPPLPKLTRQHVSYKSVCNKNPKLTRERCMLNTCKLTRCLVLMKCYKRRSIRAACANISRETNGF